MMFLFYYNPCNSTTASIEAEIEQERLKWRENEKQGFREAFPKLLARILGEAKNRAEIEKAEMEISSLLSKAERQGTLPADVFKNTIGELCKAMFAFTGKLVERLSRPVLESLDGKARERFAIRLLDHPFFDRIEMLEKRADILKWQLVNAGCCTMGTRRLQILSVPKSIREKIMDSAKSRSAAEQAIVAISPACLDCIMERKRAEQRMDTLVEGIKSLIREAPEPPSNGTMIEIFTSGIDINNLMRIEGALYDRCGFDRVNMLVEDIARERWPKFADPVHDGFWAEKREARVTGKQNIWEMEAIMRNLRRKGAAGNLAEKKEVEKKKMRRNC